MHKQTMIEVGN